MRETDVPPAPGSLESPTDGALTGEVLGFEAASFQHGVLHDCELRRVDFTLGPGQLALVYVPARALRLPLIDAAQGLAPAHLGEVRFEGRTWRERSHEERVSARGRMGRVFEGSEWVSNLDVDENVILAACHHSARPEPEILEEVSGLAGRFGLSDPPDLRQGLVSRVELRAWSLVRAFAGKPSLLLLERPLREAPAQFSEPFEQCLEEARARGAAVLMTTTDMGALRDPRWRADLCFDVQPPELIPTDPPASDPKPTP